LTVEVSRYAVWSGLDPLSIDEAVAYIQLVESAGYGAFWTREGFGRDPFALLAVAARSTSSLVLGTGIANIYGRDAASMRSAAGTLHELAQGRFVLGLGVSHKPWVEDLRGHRYTPPITAMRSYIEAYHSSPYRVATPFGSPAIVVAALRTGMLRLAGEVADGAFPYLVPLRSIASLRQRLDESAAAAGRPRPSLIVAQVVRLEADASRALTAATAYLRNYLALPAYTANLLELGFDQDDLAPDPSPRLASELVTAGDEAAIRGRLREALAAGADQVAVVPLNEDGSVGNRETVAALAPPW
jgi:probable F420-dependent oxidoreductase